LTIPDAEAKNAPASSRRAWATSFRNGGRHHLGIPGGIIPESPGGFLGIRIIVYGALFWLACHVFVVAYEEPTLERTFGAQYEPFRANVPRWIPRTTPWRAE